MPKLSISFPLGAMYLAMSALCAAPALAGFELVMVETEGCVYCDQWNADVSPEYGATPEGQFAPLRRVNLHDLPEELEFSSRPVYTPTFVLVEDGTEVGRLEGYASEDFFWGLLGRLLSQGDPNWAAAASN